MPKMIVYIPEDDPKTGKTKVRVSTYEFATVALLRKFVERLAASKRDNGGRNG